MGYGVPVVILKGKTRTKCRRPGSFRTPIGASVKSTKPEGDNGLGPLEGEEEEEGEFKIIDVLQSTDRNSSLSDLKVTS